MISVTSQFDSGNIEVVSTNNPADIKLKIRKDTCADFLQWFYFRVTGCKDKRLGLKILNAGEAAYPDGYKGFQVRASYDKKCWFLIETSFDGQTLSFSHQPAAHAVYYAYFAPYSYERHLAFIDHLQFSDLVNYESLGKTVEGREIDFFRIGDEGASKKKIWVIARQHPGESQASFFMEGFINRLINASDPVSRVLLENAVFYVVPLINPDGVVHGNLRANAAGQNLNREWANPDPVKAPEVFYIMKKMAETGVDLNLDIHADEELPYVFISSIEGIPSYDNRLRNLLTSFKNHWKNISPDFQDEVKYPVNEPGTANLNICSKAIGERFKCLSMTIEMPFKDNANLPDPVFGWSPERSEKLGESVLDVILRVVDDLR